MGSYRLTESRRRRSEAERGGIGEPEEQRGVEIPESVHRVPRRRRKQAS
jgi:hypothetical protein